ncbi:hypothetical protein GCM10025864_14390 [Luteimicrobium album]|uniref:Uncharacterized protein n=1 Tax=Luteimicrobium album TaxID=1054550 RepID=A0ABQ6HYV8_9MICO|nr:hypothetical protein GCM10025864_14390 [Luteimicrobium album]
MRLAGLGCRLRPDRVLGTRERQEFPRLGGIEDDVRGDHETVAVCERELDGADRVCVTVGTHGTCVADDAEGLGGDVRSEERLDRPRVDGRRCAQAADVTEAGVEQGSVLAAWVSARVARYSSRIRLRSRRYRGDAYRDSTHGCSSGGTAWLVS